MNLEAVLIIGIGTLVAGLILLLPGVYLGRLIANKLKKTHPNNELSRALSKQDILVNGVLVCLFFMGASVATLAPNSSFGAQFQGASGAIKGLVIFITISMFVSIAIGLFRCYREIK